ncbi:unnamed protein product [Prunus armeniaca]
MSAACCAKDVEFARRLLAFVDAKLCDEKVFIVALKLDVGSYLRDESQSFARRNLGRRSIFSSHKG